MPNGPVLCSSAKGHLGCLHYLTIMNDAAVNIQGQVCVWMHASSSLGHIPEGGTAGSHDDLSLVFWVIAKLFSNAARSCF